MIYNQIVTWTAFAILAMFALRTEVKASKVVSEVRSCDRGDEIIIGIDNTFLTPWVSNHSEPEILKKSIIWRKSQVVRPLTFGVDLVMHSCTKVVCGQC